MSADQHFSVILTVDLSCNRCYDKIKKVLGKHQEKWGIQSTIWDEKNNKITLTGPFCPRKLSKRLRRKAGKIIKDVDIPDACDCDPDKKKPAKPKPTDSKRESPKKEEPKSAPPPPAPKPEPAPAAAAPDPPKEKPKPAEPTAPKPKAAEPKPAEPKSPQPAGSKPKAAEPKAAKPAEPEAAPVPYPYPYPPVFPMPICWGGPWCECQAVGGCTPCGYGGACGGVCGGDPRRGHEGCRVEFFCEEDSTCRPM